MAKIKKVIEVEEPTKAKTIVFPQSLYDKIEARSKKEDRSTHYLIIKACEKYFK
jgi:hypothetical protein